MKARHHVAPTFEAVLSGLREAQRRGITRHRLGKLSGLQDVYWHRLHHRIYTPRKPTLVRMAAALEKALG